MRSSYPVLRFLFDIIVKKKWEREQEKTNNIQSVRPFAQVINVSGKIHSKTTNIDAPLPISPQALARAEQGLITFETFKLGKHSDLRQVTLPVLDNDLFTGQLVQIATSLGPTHSSLNNVALMLWVVVPCFCLLSFVFGFFL